MSSKFFFHIFFLFVLTGRPLYRAKQVPGYQLLLALFCTLMNWNRICLDWCSVSWAFLYYGWAHLLAWQCCTLLFCVVSCSVQYQSDPWLWACLARSTNVDVKHLNSSSQFVCGHVERFRVELNWRKIPWRRKWRLMNPGWHISPCNWWRVAEQSSFGTDQENTCPEVRPSSGGVLL